MSTDNAPNALAPVDLADIKALREETEAAVEFAKLTAAQHKLRTIRAFESYEIVDRFDDADYRGDWQGLPDLSPNMNGDRQDGQMYPVFQTEQDLTNIRGWGRILACTQEPGVAAMNALQSYVIGKGFSYGVTSRKGQAAPEKVLQLAQDVLKEFLDESAWVGDRESEAYLRLRRDGETFIVLNYQRDGRTQPRFIEPEQVTETSSTQWSDSYLASMGVNLPFATTWRFGVHRAAHDAETILGYNVLWDGAFPSYYPAEQIEHWKGNVDRNVARGVSDFYVVRNTLQRWAKLHRNTAIGAAVQAAIAWIETMALGATSSSVGTMSANLAAGQFNRNTGFGTRSTSAESYGPASIVRTENGREYNEGPGGKNSASFVLVMQAILRAAGLRWSMPEFLISGDASNANYSSTIVAESPWVKFCEREQGSLVQKHQAILWKVFQHSHKFGRLAEVGLDWESFKKLVDLQIVGPQVAARDQLKENQTYAIQRKAGVISIETWQQKVGLDPEIERTNMAAETEELVAKAEVMGKAGLNPDGTPQKVQPEPGADGKAKAKARLAEAVANYP